MPRISRAAFTGYSMGDEDVATIMEDLLAGNITKGEASFQIEDRIRRGRESKRVFDYDTEFPQIDAECEGQILQRTFVHTDWIDGESVVQAGETAAEDGFNKRFNSIASDIDGLIAEVSRAFVCLKDMREKLHVILEEIRSEINYIHSEIYECCQERDQYFPFYPYPYPYSYQMFPPQDLLAGGKLVGTTTIDDKPFMVYDYDGRLEMLPMVATPDITDMIVKPEDDIRVSGAGDLGLFLYDEPDVKDFFADHEITKESLIENFGDREIREGVTVEKVVGGLPDDVVYEDLDHMIDAVSDRGAEAVTTTGEAERVAGHFGVGTDVETVSETPVARMRGVSSDVNKLLVNGGIDTIGKLAESDRRTVKRKLRNLGRDITDGEVTAMITNARTLRRIG